MSVFGENQGCGVGGKMSDTNSDLSKISDSRLRIQQNEVWLSKRIEIAVQSKNSLFQQKFHKKLYHFNRNSQLRSVI